MGNAYDEAHTHHDTCNGTHMMQRTRNMTPATERAK